MIPGIVAASRRAPVASLALWTPLDMSVVPQIYLDAQDSVVTDVSGFASAISNLGAMGSNGDFSQATAGNRPAILSAELGGKRVLRFDGTNDVLLGGSTAQKDLFRNSSAGWAFMVHKKRATDDPGVTRRIFHCSNGVNANSRFSVGASSTSNPNKPSFSAQRLDADTSANLFATAAHTAVYVMMLVAINFSTRTGRIYINGSMDAENATLTAAAGSTSDTTSAHSLSIGARYDGTLLADIDLAAITLGNTYPATGEIDRLFGWAAHKYGLTASLPGGHPYKINPPYA